MANMIANVSSNNPLVVIDVSDRGVLSYRTVVESQDLIDATQATETKVAFTLELASIKDSQSNIVNFLSSIVESGSANALNIGNIITQQFISEIVNSTDYYDRATFAIVDYKHLIVSATNALVYANSMNSEVNTLTINAVVYADSKAAVIVPQNITMIVEELRVEADQFVDYGFVKST
jgi:hypothetical protein